MAVERGKIDPRQFYSGGSGRYLGHNSNTAQPQSFRLIRKIAAIEAAFDLVLKRRETEGRLAGKSELAAAFDRQSYRFFKVGNEQAGLEVQAESRRGKVRNGSGSLYGGAIMG